MQQFREQLQLILEKGTRKEDRTGTGTISYFGLQARYDLSKGFPLVTGKKTFLKGIIGELLWFLEGSTNRNRLEEITHGTRGKNNTIWDEWADPEGELGPIYSAQWRNWGGDPWFTLSGGHDQILKLVENIKRNPDSRRHIVSAWNVDQLENMALPPCHTMWQVFIADGKLSLQLYQRSADMFLGVPFNIASYALLTMMLAQVTGYEPGEFIHTIGDAHIYLNHMDQVQEYLSREPFPLPQMKINKAVEDIFSFTMSDFELVNYQCHPTIKAPVAV